VWGEARLTTEKKKKDCPRASGFECPGAAIESGAEEVERDYITKGWEL